MYVCIYVHTCKNVGIERAESVLFMEVSSIHRCSDRNVPLYSPLTVSLE